MPTLARSRATSFFAGQQVFTIEHDLTHRTLLGVQLEHAVENTQQSGLSATRGANKSRHLVLGISRLMPLSA
jgi:hypothetical protein